MSRLGYDGKGQALVNNAAELESAFAAMNREPCVLEKRMPLESEISVIVARAFNGEVATFPVPENQHRHGILDISIVPARVSPAVIRNAREIAVRVAEKLDYRGVLCVEFFVLADEKLLVNEVAPRPHNSGHYTIDACTTSQFEQQVRILCGIPLGSTAMHGAAVMVNLLGDLWRQGEPEWEQVLRHPNVKLHLYGKLAARPGRKMGHYTVLDRPLKPRCSLRWKSSSRLSVRRSVFDMHRDTTMMNDTSALFETSLQSLPLLHRGKVRDIYEVDDDKLLIIQTDRLSAFDVILPTPVPGKGKLLTVAIQLLVRETRSHRSQSSYRHIPGIGRSGERTRTGGRPRVCGKTAEAAANRSHRARLRCGFRMEGL